MSNLFSLNVKDAVRGLIVAVLSAVITLVLSILQNGGVIDWKQVGIVALIAGLGYILKNFLSDKEGNPLGIGTEKVNIVNPDIH